MTISKEIVELEEKFLSRIRTQNRFYRKSSNRVIFPIGMITTVVNQGKRGNEAEMTNFIKDIIIPQIVVHYKSEKGNCTSCVWRDLVNLTYNKVTCLVSISTSEDKGILIEPPVSEYTVNFIRSLSTELADVTFKQQEMVLEKPTGKGSRGKQAIHGISLDHIIPINLFLMNEIAEIALPKLYELSEAIKSLPGFDAVNNQEEFDKFWKDNLNEEIKSKCFEVFEEFKNEKSKYFEYLFSMQLMSRGDNSAKNDNTI